MTQQNQGNQGGTTQDTGRGLSGNTGAHQQGSNMPGQQTGKDIGQQGRQGQQDFGRKEDDLKSGKTGSEGGMGSSGQSQQPGRNTPEKQGGDIGAGRGEKN